MTAGEHARVAAAFRGYAMWKKACEYVYDKWLLGREGAVSIYDADV